MNAEGDEKGGDATRREASGVETSNRRAPGGMDARVAGNGSGEHSFFRNSWALDWSSYVLTWKKKWSTDDESNDSEHEILTHRGVATTRRHVRHGHAAAQAQDWGGPRA